MTTVKNVNHRCRPIDYWRMLGAGIFLGLFIYAWPGLWPRGQQYLTQEFKNAEYIDIGESLLHRIPGDASRDVSRRMPLATLSNALIFNHAPLSSALRAMPGFVEVVLLFAVVQLLVPAGVLPPAAALAIILSVGSMQAYARDGEACYALLMLLVSGLMIWRAQARSFSRSVLLASAIGASLLYRSPLALLPPLLVCFEYFTLSRRRPPRFRRQLLILLTVPYLFLLPWLRMNRIAYHRWIPFEDAAADTNIAAGALGLVHDIYCNWTTLSGQTDDKNVLVWAFEEVARHPLRYVTACVARAHMVIGLHPLLFLSAFFAIYLFRKDPGYQQLGVLCVYFVSIHCLMSTEPRYFEPLWPLLAAAAAGLLAGPRSVLGNFDCLEYRLSSYILKSSLALVLIFSIFSEHAVNAYAEMLERGGQQRQALNEALEKHSGDAWLYFERGRLETRESELPAADADLTEACALRPMILRYQLALAWVRALRGRPGQLFAWRTHYPPTSIDFHAHILRADFYIKTGKIQKARKDLRGAFNEQYARLHNLRETPDWPALYDVERNVFQRINDLPQFSREANNILLYYDRPDSEKTALRRIIGSFIGFQ